VAMALTVVENRRLWENPAENPRMLNTSTEED
jgi:hypothetical protein